MKNKKSIFIIIAVLIASIVMIYVDNFLRPSYFIKAVIKAVLFLGFPAIYSILFHDSFSQVRNLFVAKKGHLLKSLAMGAGIGALILCAYFCLRPFVDFAGVAASLDEENFIPIIIYVALCNSLLEEFFFRGFAFMLLKKEGNRKFAYVFSSALFAAYHTGVVDSWFGVGLFALMMVGLFIGGCIFNWLNESHEDIYSSWFVHMFINVGINIVGCILLDII